MKSNEMRFLCATVVALAALLAAAAAPTVAQTLVGANTFPTEEEDDGKFVALAGTEFATLTQGNLSFSVQVTDTQNPVSSHDCVSDELDGRCVFLGVFDGETSLSSFRSEGGGRCSTTASQQCDIDADCPGMETCETPDERYRDFLGNSVDGPYQHWDNFDGRGGAVPGTQLGIALFRDVNQMASTAEADFLGYWEGDSLSNRSQGPGTNREWVTFGGGNFRDLLQNTDLPGPVAAFVDNDWWNLELEVDEAGECAPGPGCAVAATGAASYHLCLFYNPPAGLNPYPDNPDSADRAAAIAQLCEGRLEADGAPETVSVFKAQAESEIALLSDSFAFEGSQHGLVDVFTLFPLFPNDAGGLFVPGATSTYDGNWEFLVFVPADRAVRELTLFDGDFDFGTRSPLAEPFPGFPQYTGTTSFPSEFTFSTCTDDDDPDSPAHPDFVLDLGLISPVVVDVPPLEDQELRCKSLDPNAGDLALDDYAIPPPLENRCSATTSLECAGDADCPSGETCGARLCGQDGSVAQTAKAAGTPADDNFFDLFRRFADPSVVAGEDPAPPAWNGTAESPLPPLPKDCVVYRLISPLGDVYRNPNPSSQREWEQFRVVSRCEIVDSDPAVRECGCTDPINPIPGLDDCPATLPNGSAFPEELYEVFDPGRTDDEQADYVVNDETLPAGLWKVEIFGVDMSNLNAWAGPRFCPAGECIVTPPYKVGDTVWQDTDLDEKQSPDEPGIPDVKINLIEAEQLLAMKTTGEEDQDESLSCENCNTGGDPSGPADPAFKTPVDTLGLFCFDVDVPPAPRRCSLTTSQECGSDADCPAGETCTQNCRDFVVEVDDSNFLPGGPLDGFGPTTPSPRKECEICEAAGGAVTLNCDFGYAPCDECDGKVSALTLEYLGGAAAQVRVDQKNGDTVFGPALVQPGDELTLGPGTDKGTYGPEVRVYVDGTLHVKIHTSCSQPIFPGLIQGDFEVVRGASRNGDAFCPAQCRPTQLEDLEIQDDELKWRIKNSGNTPITVSRVVLEWPVEKGNLKKMELDGTFFEQLVAPPAADISSGFVADVGKRTLDVGQDKDLKFRFDDKFDAGQYFIRVEFGDESCSLETSGAACLTNCDKPIHDLSMIWTGSEAVDVTAWKGSVGGTSLGTQTVAPGGRVTFGDFEGSPNDVVWEIFRSGTDIKLGESKFHLSCSDDEMNGPEDCGKPQGDGKSNDSDLLNDWTFDGWRDKDELLTCSPEPICEPSDPPPPGDACLTDCEKPIHDLSMIWNGAETVNVTAWKGSVGSTSLGTQTAMPGQRITFGDFAGSPNDVIWEIFALGGGKLGESKFHLSCSDSEMNGADDCGQAQGNGKSNESDLINNWIFDGWRDDDETLTCSPEPICEPSDPPPGGSFDCSKPIDALTMVWDGAVAVGIKAWKGSVGSTLLADVGGILPGGVPGTPSEVTVAGFAGSPNDVIWEVFDDASGAKLGESKFHLSCSDSEMNGAEDCGNAEGNGKGNDSSLINDWVFEGMIDSNEVLDCTSTP